MDEAKPKEIQDSISTEANVAIAEPHDFVGVAGAGGNSDIVRCPKCEHLIKLVKLGENTFALENL